MDNVTEHLAAAGLEINGAVELGRLSELVWIEAKPSKDRQSRHVARHVVGRVRRHASIVVKKNLFSIEGPVEGNPLRHLIGEPLNIHFYRVIAVFEMSFGEESDGLVFAVYADPLTAGLLFDAVGKCSVQNSKECHSSTPFEVNIMKNNRIHIVYGASDAGKSVVGDALVLRTGGRIVDEWDGKARLLPGDIALTNIMPPPVDGAVYIEVKKSTVSAL
jgi:hypothetical protein